MARNSNQKMFLNLAVREVNRVIAFFTKVGSGSARNSPTKTRHAWWSIQPRGRGGVGEAVWGGDVAGGLLAVLPLVDGGMKLFKPPVVVDSTLQLGYPESAIAGIGGVLLISTIPSLIPRTAIPGAILLTGYLGGAVATHVRVSATLFNIFFPVFFGALLWSGLWLRDRRLRDFLPQRAQ